MPVRVQLRIIIGLTSEVYLFAYQKDLKENSSARASTTTRECSATSVRRASTTSRSAHVSEHTYVFLMVRALMWRQTPSVEIRGLYYLFPFHNVCFSFFS